jgi:hypothetical protein
MYETWKARKGSEEKGLCDRMSCFDLTGFDKEEEERKGESVCDRVIVGREGRMDEWSLFVDSMNFSNERINRRLA